MKAAFLIESVLVFGLGKLQIILGIPSFCWRMKRPDGLMRPERAKKGGIGAQQLIMVLQE